MERVVRCPGATLLVGSPRRALKPGQFPNFHDRLSFCFVNMCNAQGSSSWASTAFDKSQIDEWFDRANVA